MKKLFDTKSYSLLLFLMTLCMIGKGQLVLDTSPQSMSCNIGSFGSMSISVPSEVLTGDNIPLNITLPGTMSASCIKSVTVTHSSNLQFQTSGGIGFMPMAPQTYQNASPLSGNVGQNFNLFFKFPNYVTCDGTMGSLQVSVTVDCGGQQYTCSAAVNVKARAANYWSVRKEFISGNLVCGNSHWRIYVEHNNPNGGGLGTYSLQGTLTENAPTPVISGAFNTVSITNPSSNGSFGIYNVYLSNCIAEGSTLTNNVDYDFQLGNNCGTMTGTASKTSPPMSSPNAHLSFTKSIRDLSKTNLTPGCQARYRIQLYNNGNVPWTNIIVTDDLDIPGITLLSAPTLPTGWTMTNVGGQYTLNGGSNVLAPGETITIDIPFVIDSGTPIGSSIVNTAYVTYQAVGADPGSSGGNTSPSTACPGINCPEIDTDVQNDDASVTFVVEEARPIPIIKKCILNAPNNLNPPIYQIGNTIQFAINIWNIGSGNLSTVVSDALTAAGQNLQIIPSSIQYQYLTNVNASNTTTCNPSGQLEGSVPFPVVANTNDLQHPTFTITNMPGMCEINRGNVLRIIFEAKILPQLHGSKTNAASLVYNNTNPVSVVNYAVDQVGILHVSKRADREVVENGQTFNYIIEVKNNGSVPLNTIHISDPLPSCVELAGQVTVTNMAGGAIASTTSSNIQVQVAPATALAPGETFTITIPVRKTQGSTCCNVGVTATARMTTSGVELSANYGTAAEPAACVTSLECCDIPGFTAQMFKRDGKYYIQVSGGTVPIQELDVTMLDFHVSYSQEDCKPADMGIFGQLSSTTTQLGGLVLQGNGPAGTLTWGLGQPTMVNGQLEIEVSAPHVLDITCCEVTFTFCLKVRVKDVNCNVCEKTICYNGEPEVPPCDLVITQMSANRTFCPGDVIQLNWSGSTPSGSVDIYLVDGQSHATYQVLASGVSGTNSFSYTIPADFPCSTDRIWYLVIKDPKTDCFVETRKFRIICCAPACACGFWKTHDVIIKHILTATPHDQFEASASLLKKSSVINVSQKAPCGTSIRLSKGSYTFTAPDFVCQPENCTATFEWEISGPNGLLIHGTGKTFAHQFTQFGNYSIKFTPICGNAKCEPCIIRVNIPRFILGGDIAHEVLEGIKLN